jgi:multimeric flavodoxin WrbA
MKGKPNKRKVLVITGSPRPEGNSTVLAGEAAKGAREAGAEVTVFNLAGFKISPCRACDGCRKRGAAGCVQKDDMRKLYPRLKETDSLLIAGPVYWFTMCGQVKLFMDRLYALGADNFAALKGKRVGIILTYADADPFASGAVNALRAFQDAFAYVGAPIAGMVYASAGKAGEVRKNAAAMKDALELGRALAAGK